MIEARKKFMRFAMRNRGIMIILLLGLLARLAYFNIAIHNFGINGFYLSSPNGDSVEYVSLAEQWLAHGTFQDVNDPSQPSIFRMPGYPLFIAFFYKIIPAAALPILAQNLIFIFFIAFFYKFALAVLGNKKIALASAAFLAFEPSIIYWNNELITESLFACFVFFSVYCAFLFYRDKRLYYPALAGLCLAYAVLIRPAGEYLLAVFAIFFAAAFFLKIVSFKKFILSILLISIGFLAPLSPWMARNKDTFGSFGISNSSNIAFGKYLSAMSERLGETEEALKINAPFNALTRAGIRRDAFLAYAAKHPAVFLRIYFLSLTPFFMGDGYVAVFGRIFPGLENGRVVTDWKGSGFEFLSFLRGHSGMEAVIFFFGKVAWASIAVLAVLGLAYWLFSYKKHYAVLALILMLIFYFSFMSGIGSYSRFRFPVNPYIFLFAAAGVQQAVKFWKNKRIPAKQDA